MKSAGAYTELKWSRRPSEHFSCDQQCDIRLDKKQECIKLRNKTESGKVGTENKSPAPG
jgi:hypothetical protein